MNKKFAKQINNYQRDLHRSVYDMGYTERVKLREFYIDVLQRKIDLQLHVLLVRKYYK